MTRIVLRAFYKSFLFEVEGQPFVKGVGITRGPTYVGETVIGQAANGSHPEFIALRAFKRVQIKDRAPQQAREKSHFGYALCV
jgi:hypothetical protein